MAAEARRAVELGYTARKQKARPYFESPIPQQDIEGNLRVRSQTQSPIVLHVGVPSLATAIQQDLCDGFLVGGGMSAVLRRAAILSAFNKPFFLQVVGTGITARLALHIGVRGMRLETVPDDGSPGWAEMQSRVQQGPVHTAGGELE